MTSIPERRVSLTIKLAQDTQTNQPSTFAESGGDTVTIDGLRTSVRIVNSGAPADSRAQVKIFGMTPSLMNQLSTLGLVFNLVPKNTITIQAGDDEIGISPVYSGTIFYAYGMYEQQPNVPFHFECLPIVADAVAPAPVSSFKQATKVADIMSGLARQMSYGFENNGVDGTLPPSYFSGTLPVQIQKVAEAAGIKYGFFNGNKLAIWPKGGNRETPNVPTVSPATGMIGYPCFTQQGIIVRTLFNRDISFGSLIRVESSVLAATAAAQPQANFPTQWAVNKLDLALDAFMPGGQWEMTIYAYNPGYAKTIIPPASSSGSQ